MRKTLCRRASVMMVCASTLGAAEPPHEAEAEKNTPTHAASTIVLGVPEKSWLSKELYSAEKGNYSVLIWGHCGVPKAMPEGFDVEEEVRHLARHGIDWYSAVSPTNSTARDQYKRWAGQTGMQVSLGFPSSSTADEALQGGASPSNPSEVRQGKKPKIAPIDPNYVDASLKLIARQFGKKEDLRWVRSVHFHDEPSGDMPYYDIAPSWNMPLARQWEQQIRDTFGMGRWGLPKDNWDVSAPRSRLAYQKFWARQYNQYQRIMSQAIREQHPHIEAWSANFWFNQGADLLWDYGEMGEFLDAIVVDSYATQQEKDSPGRGRWNAGFATKVAADLSKKPVYNHIQALEYKGATPAADDIREYASQTLRAGGIGLVYYAIDMPQYRYIRYTDPIRWQAMMDVADAFKKLPRLKIPGAQPTGVWISQETLATTGPRVRHPAPYVAYVLLGETLGVPFRYVSDWEVERKRGAALKDLKLIHVEKARFVPKNVRETLSTWVRQGGILTLTDQNSFTEQMDGTTFPSWKEALDVRGSSVSREQGDEWPHGKGRVMMLRQNPWVMQAWDQPEPVAALRKIQTEHGGGLDEPLWRFRLPASSPP